MKQRIAIVLLGLVLGLVARVTVQYYERYRSQHAVAPPAATASPIRIKTDGTR